jgi:hypothetical protein
MEEKNELTPQRRRSILFILAVLLVVFGLLINLSLVIRTGYYLLIDDLLDALRWELPSWLPLRHPLAFLVTPICFAVGSVLLLFSRVRHARVYSVYGLILLIGWSVVFPVLSNAPEGGPRWTCMSNQLQLGTAAQMYMQDNEGKLPVNLTDLLTYVGSEKLFICPDTLRRFHRKGGYGLNTLLRHKVEKDFPDPAFTIVTADSVNPDGVLYSLKDVDLTRHGSSQRGRGFLASYLDGHVKFIPAKEAAKVQVGIAKK